LRWPKENETMTNIVLSSNQPMLIAGFQTVIQTSDEFSLSVCRDPSLLRECILAQGAHIVLADATCGITLEILAGLRANAPATAIILWVDSVSTEFIFQAISLGIRGVLRKNADIEMCLRCLREVAAGEFWIENEVSKKLLGTRTVNLTPRERQITGQLAQGLTNKELAHVLGITVGTVKVYLSRLYAKVGVGDRFELTLFTLKHLASDQLSASENLVSSSAAGARPFFMPRTVNILQRAPHRPASVCA
jgi:DNA-binding NarL/FixJ family response regulator